MKNDHIKIFIFCTFILLNLSSIRAENAVDQTVYNQKTFELAAIFYGVVEIGGKSCKGAGKSMPKSLEKWWSVVNAYQQNESNLAIKTEAQQEELLTELNNSEASKQFDSIHVQEKSIDVGINAISGPGGRIPLREDLLKAIGEIKKLIAEEKEKSILVFNNFKDKAIPEAIAVAKKACERTKLENECTADESGAETCVSVEKKDPVPGCDVAIKNYNDLATPLEDYKKLFLMSQVPSTELNEKMDDLEKKIKELLDNTPKSNDSNFDWSSNVSKKYLAMEDTRKELGILCPSSDGETQLDRSELNKIVPTRNATKGNNSEKVSTASVNFLNSIGASVDSSNASSTFTGTWNLADTVIGQPGQRALYFDYVAEKLNDVLTLDDQHLNNATATKEEVHKYAENVENELNSGSTFENATTIAKQASAITNSVNNLNNNLGNNNGNLAMAGLNAIETSSGTNNLIRNNTQANSSAISRVGSTSSGNSVVGSGAGGAGNSNAIGSASNNRGQSESHSNAIAVKNKQTDDKDENGSLKNNKSSSRKDRLSEFNIKFTHKKNDSNPVAQKLNSLFNGFKSSAESEKIYQLASNRYKSKNRSREDVELQVKSKKVASKVKGKKSKGYKNEFVEVIPEKRTSKRADTRHKANYEFSEDSQILTSAINAKKRGSNNYQKSEDDTLFDILTKAYIRNYERIEN